MSALALSGWRRRRDARLSETEKRITEARETLDRLIAQAPHVSEVVASVVQIRERNHIAEQITEALRPPQT